jgi:hypothetical protein
MSIINQHIVGHRGASRGRIPASSIDLVNSAPYWTALEYDTRSRETSGLPTSKAYDGRRGAASVHPMRGTVNKLADESVGDRYPEGQCAHPLVRVLRPEVKLVWQITHAGWKLLRGIERR